MPKIPEDAKHPEDHRSKIEGKNFVWATEDGDTLTIPLRIKMKVLRSLSQVELDVDGMFAMIEAVAPGQIGVVDEMDTNDFQDAFAAWQAAYKARSGASLGESSSSSTSSTSTEQPSTTTGAPASTSR